MAQSSTLIPGQFKFFAINLSWCKVKTTETSDAQVDSKSQRAPGFGSDYIGRSMAKGGQRHE